jgi:DNA-binding CsgD family transcriptional regulator
MIAQLKDSSLYFESVETYATSGFPAIYREDYLILKIEAMPNEYYQYLLVANLIKIQILFKSNRIRQKLGIEPYNSFLNQAFEATHPDEELLQKGKLFSEHELEIIKLIHQGLSSDKIAKKLFLSRQTIQIYRKNILAKGNKNRMAKIVFNREHLGLL